MNPQNIFSCWGGRSFWKWSPKCLAALWLLSISNCIVVWSFCFKICFVLLLLVPEGLYRHPLSPVISSHNENRVSTSLKISYSRGMAFIQCTNLCFDFVLDIPCAHKRFSYTALCAKHLRGFFAAVLVFMQGTVFHFKDVTARLNWYTYAKRHCISCEQLWKQ